MAWNSLNFFKKTRKLNFVLSSACGYFSFVICVNEFHTDFISLLNYFVFSIIKYINYKYEMKNKVNKNKHNFFKKTQKIRIRKKKKSRKKIKKAVKRHINLLLTQNKLLRSLHLLLLSSQSENNLEFNIRNRSSNTLDISIIYFV